MEMTAGPEKTKASDEAAQARDAKARKILSSISEQVKKDGKAALTLAVGTPVAAS